MNKPKEIKIECAGLTHGMEFVAELVTVGVQVAVYRKDKEGRMRKIRQVNFEPVGMFASDDPNDLGPWAAQIMRLIVQREDEAEKKVWEHLHKEQQQLEPETNGARPHPPADLKPLGE